MEKQIYQLVYVSHATGYMDDQDLLKILEASRKNNPGKDITGILLYYDQNIIQLLEGQKEEVEGLFKIIKNDPRHRGVIRLLAGFCKKRDFPNWSMGLRRVRGSEIEQHSEGMNNLVEKTSLADHELDELSIKVRSLITAFRTTSGIS